MENTVLASEAFGNPKHTPLLILHGLFGNSSNWRQFAKAWATQGYYTHSLDLRNHGRSFHNSSMSYTEMAKDLAEWMQHQELEKAHILGHSMGGKTAMQFALIYPEKVENLVIVDIAPRHYSHEHLEIIEAMNTLPCKKISSRSEADAHLAKTLESPSLRQFLLKNLKQNADKHWHWQLNIAAIEKNYPHILESPELNPYPAFAQPTLFIKGENSQYIQDSDHIKIHKHFPNAEIISIPDAGHWVHAEKPEEVSQLVLNFIG